MCPVQWKTGLVLGLLHRAFLVCSSWSLLHAEIEKIIDILKSNGYPHSFLYRIVRQFLNKKFQTSNTHQTNQIPESTKKYTFSIPFLGTPSLLLKKKLVKIFQRYSFKINVVFHSFKVRNYFSLKDKSNRLLRSSLVYKFKCLGDPSTSYIGKTKRYLHKRVTEHTHSGSAVHSHITQCSVCQPHDIFDQFSVLDSANTDFDLQILEALHIIDKRPILNKQLTGNGSSFILNIF